MRIAVIATVGVCLAAGLLVFLLWPEAPAPDAAEAPPGEVFAYLASEVFGRKSADEKADYLQELWRQDAGRLVELMAVEELPEDQRARVTVNARDGMIRMMARQAKECFALPEAGQDEYIDDQLAEMMQKMLAVSAARMMSGKGASRPPFGPQWGGKEPSADEVQKRIEELLSVTTPEDRAYLQAYRQKMMERMPRGMRPDS